MMGEGFSKAKKGTKKGVKLNWNFKGVNGRGGELRA